MLGQICYESHEHFPIAHLCERNQYYLDEFNGLFRNKYHL